jgi:hypothetical protein
LQWAQQSIKNILDDISNYQLAYVTHEDICDCFSEQTLLAIQASNGKTVKDKRSTSVPDPDPHVFGPPGSGLTSQMDPDPSIIKNSKINLDSFYFVTLFDFLSLKNDVNVPSKSKKQKKLC